MNNSYSYQTGIFSGFLILILLLYHVRKNFPWIGGNIRLWFHLHMFIGAITPFIVIAHTRLYFGSLNATIAFISLMIVAISGVYGRYLYNKVIHTMGHLHDKYVIMFVHWHIYHKPFVILMIIAVTVHIVAVHMY
jgi:hypothetical protein